MIRLPDWAARLHDFIDSVKREPFSWDGGDCALGWAARAVEAQTGVDPVAAYRGKFKTAKGALAAMKKMGASDLAEAAALFLPRHDHPSQAQIGDIAAVPKDDAFGFTLGIVNGETILVLREDGMGIVPRTAATQAFKVG